MIITPEIETRVIDPIVTAARAQSNAFLRAIAPLVFREAVTQIALSIETSQAEGRSADEILAELQHAFQQNGCFRLSLPPITFESEVTPAGAFNVLACADLAYLKTTFRSGGRELVRQPYVSGSVVTARLFNDVMRLPAARPPAPAPAPTVVIQPAQATKSVTTVTNRDDSGDLLGTETITRPLVEAAAT